MNDNTVPQFGRSLREEAAAPSSTAARATVCPSCGSHFSPDGRFCPFDGSALAPAKDWDPAADALLGSVIDGRYEVQSVLGEGGMGTVYVVRHAALGKRFALKALRKDLAADGEIAARFIQEARTAAAVSHPGLVEITDFGRLASGQVYFVMEFLDGQSLSALIRLGGPLPAARGLEIVRQLANALKAAHDASIVHRDLKPDNIHVGRGDGERDLVKVVDFGLAKVIGSSKLTRAGMVFGTPHYMSPEQAAGDMVDHRADIYALGIVMYEMFTGRVPFEADSYMGVLTKHMYMAPAPPSDLRPQLKELGALEDVIMRCLQKRPAARYENLAALLRDLEQLSPAGSGGTTARRARPASLLADQLELPSRDELLGERVKPRPLWPIVVVVLAFLFGIALVLALRWRPLPRSRPAPRAELAATASIPAAAATQAAQALPLVSAAPSAPAAVAAPPRPSLVFEPAPRQTKPRSPPPRRQGQPAAAKGRIGAGEIVDPWAR